jgi:hypothetical protein
VRIDSAGKITARIEVGPKPVGIAVGAGHVWVSVYGSDRVEAIR